MLNSRILSETPVELPTPPKERSAEKGFGKIHDVIYKKDDLVFVKVKCDIGLFRPDHENEYILVFMNIYGSASEVRAIHSAVASREVLELNEMYVYRDNTILKARSWNIGYGKYQMLVWHEEAEKNCIIRLPGESDVEVWKRFLNRRKIPFTDEWIPHLRDILLREGYVEVLYGVGGVKGWYWKTSDDEVCDLIVEKIWK
jgi:hypothetical protein